MQKMLRKITVPILLLVLVVYFSFAAPGFASMTNLFNLLRQIAILGIVSAGMTPVIISGQIDLSVGSVLSFASCCIAILITQYAFDPVAACLVGILISMTALVLNCLVVMGTGMPAMLCTLATMQIYQGVSYVVTGGTPIYGLPESMRMAGQGYLWIIPVPVILMVAVFVLIVLVLAKTCSGRFIYAVGSNSEASRLSGVSVFKTTLVAFALCGALVGIAACVQTSRLFGGFPTAGSGLEMEVVTAVVVGGVSFTGGKGKMSGVAMGVLLMGVLYNGLGIMGVNTYTQMVVRGLVLIAVVGIDCWQQSRAKALDLGD